MKALKAIPIILLLGCTSPIDEQPLNPTANPSGPNASLPYLVTGDDGNLYFSWIEKKDNNWVEFYYSRLDNNQWTEPELIARGNNWFVNWADYPMIAIDRNGNMIAHLLVKSSPSTYAYDVMITSKKVGQTEWTELAKIHDDAARAEHGFVTMLPLDQEQFQVAWLDGRYTGGNDTSSAGLGAMTIRTATVNATGDISSEIELDNEVCDCCQTTGALINGDPVFLFRDKGLGIRDISIVRKEGETWDVSNNMYLDGWEIDGCPVNGPRAASVDSTLAVAWFTAARNQPKVNVIFSANGGKSFDEPIIIDDSTPIGRVDIGLIDSNRAIVSWLDTDGDKSIIMSRIVSRNGSSGEPIVISETDPSRASGFPQLTIHGDQVYFASTILDNDQSTIQMHTMKLF